MRNDAMIENPMVLPEVELRSSFDPEDYEEEKEYCALCGEDTESIYGVCDACISASCNLVTATLYGADRKTAVEINGFYASVFSASEIEEVLKREYLQAVELLPSKGKKDAETYCTDDTWDFADWLKEREPDGV